MVTAILSSAYFAPVQWFQKVNTHDTCLMEQCENFVKQTYRNRCVIATEAGTQTLSIPVEHGAKMMRDIRISDHGNWRHLHWNAIASAYGESPFFEYYADDIHPFFEKKWDFLFDFNMEITLKMCELLDIRTDIRLTTEYIKDYSTPLDNSCNSDDNKMCDTIGISSGTGTGETSAISDKSIITDYREAIKPKRPAPDDRFTAKPYYQVYALRNGFKPNMSALDLLFNMGNEAILWLL